MNKTFIFSFILTFCLLQGNSQNKARWNFDEPKTLLLEKIGTHQRYAYEPGNVIKLRTRNLVTMSCYLWEINDSSISAGQDRPMLIKDIESVYPQFSFPKKFGIYMFISGVVYFSVVSFDHLINNEIVFTKDVFVVPAALFGAGFISVSLSQKRCKIGDRWKLKVVGIRIL